MARARSPVEVLRGSADEAVRGIEGDFALLGSAGSVARVWTCAAHAVVLGVSRDVDVEVDATECASRAVAVLRRASGGGTVVIGPGTLQYAFVFPHATGVEPPSLDAVKRQSNLAVRAALAQAGVVAEIESDASGDLRVGDRKVGGLALRRVRHATLLHGSLLADADLDLMARVLRHPVREPAWRRRRPHFEFVANLGHFSADVFTRALQAP